jgi:hypothetical protein
MDRALWPVAHAFEQLTAVRGQPGTRPQKTAPENGIDRRSTPHRRYERASNRSNRKTCPRFPFLVLDLCVYVLVTSICHQRLTQDLCGGSNVISKKIDPEFDGNNVNFTNLFTAACLNMSTRGNHAERKQQLL